MKNCRIFLVLLFIILLPGCDPGGLFGSHDKQALAIQSIRVSSYDAVDEDEIIVKGPANNSLNYYEEYDRKGKLTKKISFLYGDTVSIDIYLYNETELLSEVNVYRPPGELYHHVVYSYNDKNKEERRSVYDASGILLNYDISEYSEQSRMVHHFSGSDALLSTTIYDFNDEGNLASMTLLDADDNPTIRFEYTYDGSGNVTEWRIYTGGVLLTTIVTCAYNDRQLVTERSEEHTSELQSQQ